MALTHELEFHGRLTRERQSFRVSCSCGNYTTTGDRDTVLRRLDKHMEKKHQ